MSLNAQKTCLCVLFLQFPVDSVAIADTKMSWFRALPRKSNINSEKLLWHGQFQRVGKQQIGQSTQSKCCFGWSLHVRLLRIFLVELDYFKKFISAYGIKQKTVCLEKQMFSVSKQIKLLLYINQRLLFSGNCTVVVEEFLGPSECRVKC